MAEFPIGDLPLHLLHALDGGIGYINETLSTYRLHSGGVWSPIGWAKHLERLTSAYWMMCAHFPKRLRRHFYAKLVEMEYTLFLMRRQDNRYWLARRHLLSAIWSSIKSRRFSLRLAARSPFWLLYPGFGNRTLINQPNDVHGV